MRPGRTSASLLAPWGRLVPTLLLLTACSIDLAGERADSPADGGTLESTRREPAPTARTSSSHSERFSISSSAFAQTYSFVPNRSAFVITNRDKSNGYEQRSFEYTASFAIDAATSQAKDVFYLLGTTANEDRVIERWAHEPEGARVPGTPIRFRVTRHEIYRGTSLGPIERFAVDPYGEYLLLVHTDDDGKKLTQMATDAPHTLTTLIEPSDGPWLQGEVNEPYAWLHADEGIVWRIELLGGAYYGHVLVLRDIDGDGVFSDYVVLDGQTADRLYPFQFPLPGTWAENFVDYE